MKCSLHCSAFRRQSDVLQKRLQVSTSMGMQIRRALKSLPLNSQMPSALLTHPAKSCQLDTILFFPLANVMILQCFGKVPQAVIMKESGSCTDHECLDSPAPRRSGMHNCNLAVGIFRMGACGYRQWQAWICISDARSACAN